MAIEFVKIKEGECLLCGRAGPLTGEHRVKASLIRGQFGDQKTKIFGNGRPQIAQSAKSKKFHFKSKICKDCNSSRTQAADLAFDKIHSELCRFTFTDINLISAQKQLREPVSEDNKRDFFRYFAKLICCFLADVDAPRSKSLSKFAIGESNRNPVKLIVSRDENYLIEKTTLDTDGLVKHGGLSVRFDKNKKWIKSFESSLSSDGIKYEFFCDLRALATWDLHIFFPEFIKFARSNIYRI